MKTFNYGEAILSAFEYLLETYPQVFVIGQGLWSPWYVGNTMTGLDKKFGSSRIIDTPVSEAACTGAAVGASLAGAMPIVVHPRMDFMLYAMDPIVNQAAKWSYMFGGSSNPCLTIRSIINRGGEKISPKEIDEVFGCGKEKTIEFWHSIIRQCYVKKLITK